MSAGASGTTTVLEWARSQAPHLDVVSASVPEPVLVEHNLVAVFDDADAARELVLAWERIEPADGAVGTVVLGRAPDRPSELDRPSGADPERYTRHAVSRALRGGVPGAVVGAAVLGLPAVILDGWSGAVIGAALGGAMFGSVAGGVGAYVKGTGWGEAYRHSFVDGAATSLVIASIHSHDRRRIDEALRAADGARGRLYRLGPSGDAHPTG